MNERRLPVSLKIFVVGPLLWRVVDKVGINATPSFVYVCFDISWSRLWTITFTPQAVHVMDFLKRDSLMLNLNEKTVNIVAQLEGNLGICLQQTDNVYQLEVILRTKLEYRLE